MRNYASFSVIAEQIYKTHLKAAKVFPTNTDFILYNGNTLTPLRFVVCNVTFQNKRNGFNIMDAVQGMVCTLEQTG